MAPGALRDKGGGVKDREFLAWAIDTREPDGSYLGRYYWFDGHSLKIQSHMEGNVFALFMTREIARMYLVRAKGPKDRGLYPRARVQRVRVTLRANP